ncbi:hypothetical protein [Desulfosporosinus sp. FKB]
MSIEVDIYEKIRYMHVRFNQATSQLQSEVYQNVARLPCVKQDMKL